MTQTTSRISASNPATGIFGRFLRATEIDTRLLGMVGALVAIWVGFHIYGIVANGSGVFLTPRNLWNLSVQTASIGIMACGMVLVIITRHIDLSVGSLLGFAAMVMGITQVWVLPQWLGLGHPAIWIIASIVGMSVGASIGAFHGWLVAYRGIPAFIVTLGGLLVWRGAAFLLARGETISPVDANFALIGGGPYGSIGATGSWIVGLAACSGIVWLLVQGRKGYAGMSLKVQLLSVNIGKKYSQPLEDAYLLELSYRVTAATPKYLEIQLDAAQGPLSTRNYRIKLQAVPLESGRTFLHLTYSYGYGWVGKVAMKTYLATIGSGKVGFTVTGRKADGQPRYIGGMRGLAERNTMRYYLAIDAYLGALAAARFEKRLQSWYNATERYSRQLHEVDWGEYLAMKRSEYQRQQKAR